MANIKLELKLTKWFTLEDLLQLILDQWSEEEMFELIKEIDCEMASFELTTKLRDHFDEMYQLDQIEKQENAVLQQIETEVEDN